MSEIRTLVAEALYRLTVNDCLHLIIDKKVAKSIG